MDDSPEEEGQQKAEFKIFAKIEWKDTTASKNPTGKVKTTTSKINSPSSQKKNNDLDFRTWWGGLTW
jgi:hypothetical protein